MLDSTPRQIYLQQLLGYTTPSYLHIPVAVNADGQKLSKQTLAPAIRSSDAAAALITALRYLKQPLNELESNKTLKLLTPQELLHNAAKRWRPELVAATRVQTMDSAR
jgi:glutamyl-Q tRNA(Asp) synthetase